MAVIVAGIVQPIDFRSDTITKPTDAMREAMASAKVGDDVFGDDPTVNLLQDKVAKLMGTQAALFTPSGTMANTIAVWTHTQRQGQILVEENCHISLYEGGNAAGISHVVPRTISTARGVFTPAQMQPHFFPDDPHFAATNLVCVENTHNWHGGTIWSVDELAAVKHMASEHNAPVHIDGARIWNAAVASACSPKAWVDHADSVMFCLSKGLSAPVGSLLCGSEEFIAKARYVRKWLGGGMRQAGILAAAGLEALEMVPRLKDDHDNAKRLAKGLSELENVTLLREPETNIVYMDVSQTGKGADAYCKELQEKGVLALNRDSGPVVRFVTHRHVSREDVDEALNRIS